MKRIFRGSKISYLFVECLRHRTCSQDESAGISEQIVKPIEAESTASGKVKASVHRDRVAEIDGGW
jgi:hypothetical protein